MKTTTKRSARVMARPKEEKRMIYVVGDDDVLKAELNVHRVSWSSADGVPLRAH
jgi:predicted methyltransferase